MLRYRVQYAKDPVTLAAHVTELNRQAKERNASQWRAVAVFRDDSIETGPEGLMPWCAFLETDRDE